MPRFDAGVRDFMLQIAARPATGRLGQHELFAWTFASLEIGRSIVDLRIASAAAPAPPPAWPAHERALCASISRLFAQPSTDALRAAEQAAVDALAALGRDAAPRLRHCVNFLLVSLRCNLIPLPMQPDAR
jgi:hypothetical protein